MAMDKMIVKQKIRNDIQSRFDTHNYLFHNNKVNEKTIRTRNRKIFKSNFYFLYLCIETTPFSGENVFVLNLLYFE